MMVAPDRTWNQKHPFPEPPPPLLARATLNATPERLRPAGSWEVMVNSRYAFEPVAMLLPDVYVSESPANDRGSDLLASDPALESRRSNAGMDRSPGKMCFAVKVSPALAVVRLNAANVPPVALPIRMPRATRRAPAPTSLGREVTPRPSGAARCAGAR